MPNVYSRSYYASYIHNYRTLLVVEGEIEISVVVRYIYKSKSVISINSDGNANTSLAIVSFFRLMVDSIPANYETNQLKASLESTNVL